MSRDGPYSEPNLFGWMPYTVFQCIDLLTVTHLEYLVLGNYINHLRQRTQLRRAELSDGYTLRFAAYEDH